MPKNWRRPVERSLASSKLAVFSVYFNPLNWVSRKRNYLEFAAALEGKADLFTVELSFSSEFFLSQSDNVFRLKAKDNNILWQKERLLNFLLDNVPKEYTDIAWIDCDVLFKDPFWVKETLDKLKWFKVVQLFSYVNLLDKNRNVTETLEGVSRFCPLGVPGFAWAARRDTLSKIKFLDNHFLGGADYVMAQACFNSDQYLQAHSHVLNFNAATKEWLSSARKEIDCSVNFLESDIDHLYHGDTVKRQYFSRYNSIDCNSFKLDDPLWTCECPHTLHNIKQYFKARDEDEGILKVNDVFDQVYVLNLKKDTEKLSTITQKLTQLEIDFKVFEAVNGDELEDIQNENGERGLTENKYALGCGISHRNIWIDAKTNGYEKILILEDDVCFVPNFEVHFQRIRELKDWKMLYLGATQYEWHGIEYFEGFYSAKETLGTFAYGIDCSVYIDLLETSRKLGLKYAIDKITSQVQSKYSKNCYVFYPNICVPDIKASRIRKSRGEFHHNKMRWNLLQEFET